MGLFDSTELNSVPSKSTQQTVSDYARPYVSDLLGKAQAFTGQATPAYTGQLTAGPSYLQNQAGQGLSGLTLPAGLTEAGANLNDISQKAQNLTFTPVNFTDTYTAPTPYAATPAVNQYTGTGAYTPTTVNNTYSSPNAYQGINAINQYASTGPYSGIQSLNQYTGTSPYAASNIQNTYQAAGQNFVPTNVTTGTFDQAAAQQYMNPYIQQALNPQLEALQRQAAINSQGDMAKLAKAGAFGGSRQAILQGENQYNLLSQQADLIGKGYNQAYTQAGQQFTADQARALQAQQVNVDQAKYAAQLGMTDAQLMAQYGMTAAQANEASRQFAQQQAATNAAQAAQYGQAAQAANVQQQQFGTQTALTNAAQAAQYGQAAQQANIQQAQYAATQGMTDAQMMAQYGMTAAQANQAAQQFAQQQALANAQNAAQYGTTAQAANIQQAQFGSTQAMTAAQQDAQALQAQQAAQQAAKQFGATYGLQGLQAATTAQQAAANAGAQEAQYGLANLQALSKAGVDQQNLDQAALNAQYNEYLRQLKYPAEMLKLQKDIVSGMPATTTNEFAPKASTIKSASGAVSNVAGIIKDLQAAGMKMPDISKYINELTKTNPVQTGGIKVDESGNYIYPTAPGGATPYDDDGNLMPGWGLDESNNPVWVSSDYIEPSYNDYSTPAPDYEYTNPDDSAYQDWWNTESYD
jgi:hypothetical protein